MSMVSVVKIQRNKFKKGIIDSLNLINYDFSSNMKDIVIKPNMCYYWDHSTGQTTDPQFVASLVEVLREKISSDVRISIVESDASAMKCKYAFRILGYEEVARRLGVSLVNLSEEKSEKVTVDVGDFSFSFNVPRVIGNASLKINVPKIKYHSLKDTKMTCALKNIYGCNPNPRKFIYHSEIGKVIIALNKLMEFDLVVVDGNVVTGGRTQRLGLVMASRDPVAVDSLAAHIVGINPRSIDYLQLANREGIGKNEFICKGADWRSFQEQYPKIGAKKKIMDKAFDIIVKLGLESRLGLD